jgi:hypothetical protein
MAIILKNGKGLTSKAFLLSKRIARTALSRFPVLWKIGKFTLDTFPVLRPVVDRVRGRQKWPHVTFERGSASNISNAIYQQWIYFHEPTPVELDRLRRSAASMTDPAELMLIMSLGAAKTTELEATLDSLRCQFLQRWNLIVLVQASAQPKAVERIRSEAFADSRIRIILGEGRLPNQIDISTDRFVAWIDPGDILAPVALYRIAEQIASDQGVSIVYSDSDCKAPNGQRCNPQFQPDWAPETFLSTLYDLGLAFTHSRLLRGSSGPFDWPVEIPPATFLALHQIGEKTGISHVQEVLLHRVRPLVKKSNAERRIIQSVLAHKGMSALVEPGLRSDFHRIRHQVAANASVSIVIPTASKKSPAGKWWVLDCVESIRGISSWKNLEIVVVDNQDMPSALAAGLDRLGVKRISYTEIDFNLSQKINRGVASSSGEFVLIMNDDMVVLEPRWIESMLEEVHRPGIGVVGAFLL